MAALERSFCWPNCELQLFYNHPCQGRLDHERAKRQSILWRVIRRSKDRTLLAWIGLSRKPYRGNIKKVRKTRHALRQTLLDLSSVFSVSTPKLWINYLCPQVQGFQGIQTVDANPSVLICKPKLWMVTLWFGLGKGRGRAW